MKRKKEDIFVIVVGVILVIIILIIAVITTNYSNSQEQNRTVETSPQPSAPLPTSNPQTRPQYLYDPTAQDTLLDRIQNRKTLSADDRLAKAKVLSNIPNNQPSGIVHQSQNIIIDYTKSADVIQVEILTTNIQEAKNEAGLWLRTQGLSQEAICDLPVGFYLNFDIASQLRKTDVVFSPLANGCN